MKFFKAVLVILASLLLSDVYAGMIHRAANSNPYANACGSQPGGQNWCVGADGWTVFTPTTTGSGACGATGTFTGTCVIYIAEGGTGTSATCRIAATAGFDFTTTIPDAQACPYTGTNISLARTASSDFLLFKRGDCFMDPGQISPCTGLSAPITNSFGICSGTGGAGCNFARNGTSPSAPLVIAAYGPLANSRPRISTVNTYAFTAQSAFGNNIAVLSLKFDGAYLFQDYTNATYNPGAILSTASSGVGATTVSLASSPSSSIINNTNATLWSLFNFSNPLAMSSVNCQAGVQISSISGSTITLANPITANYTVSVGDRILILPRSCENGGLFNVGIALSWFYLEDCEFAGTNPNLQPSNVTSLSPVTTSFFVRRNVVYDSGAVANKNQGIFLSDSFSTGSKVLVEENLFDHSGWRQFDPDCTPAQFMPAKCGGVASPQLENFYGSPNNQAQNSYDHEDCCFLTYQRNITTNAGGAGVQVRSGGILYNNLSYRNDTAGTGGGIVWPNTATYNVFGDLTGSYSAIMIATGVSGNVLTFAAVPQSLASSQASCQMFDASNPSGISQTTNTSFTFTTTTVTIGGPAISVSIGDTIYCTGTGGNAAQFGYGADAAQTGGSTIGASTQNNSNVQWNVFPGAMSSTYRGGVNGAQSLLAGSSLARATGSILSNNFIMNNSATAISDYAEIQNIDGDVSCGGLVRVQVQANSQWKSGDTITISGSLPSSMNANVSTTVSSVIGANPIFLCLAGTTFGSGTWTSGSGVINGGISFGPNYYFNVGTPINVLPAGYTQTAPKLQAFTPVGNTGCPQHTGCPSIEGYDLSIGGDGTLSHFLVRAKANRKGTWDTRYTAAQANSYIRSNTSALIPNPSF